MQWTGCVAVLLLLIALVSASGNQHERFEQLRRTLDHYIEGLRLCRQVPGLVLTVVHDGKVVVSAGYGNADLENNMRADPEGSIFCVASCTKAFTAILLARVLPRHGYSLDTPINDILSRPVKFPDSYRSSHVTVRDLLLHRTGIPRYGFTWISGAMSAQQIFRRIQCMKPVAEFRTQAIYNNIMYSLAGHVAESLERKSWARLIREEILQPLGMRATVFMNSSVHHRRDAMAAQYGHMHGEPFRLDRDRFSGASSIKPAIALCTTAVDMAKWMRFLLCRDPSCEMADLIVSRQTLDRMFTPQILSADMYENRMKRPLTPVDHVYEQYALGWFSGYYRGWRTLMHYGAFPGFFSMITLLPAKGIGIFTSFNGGVQDLPYTINSVIHTYILDLLLVETPWLNVQWACVFPDSPGNLSFPTWDAGPAILDDEHLFNPHPHQPLIDYEGVYANKVFGNLTLAIKDGENSLSLRYGNMAFTLAAVGNDVFDAKPDTAEWMMPSVPLYFHRILYKHKHMNNTVYSVLVPFLESSAPPQFYKVPADGGLVWLFQDHTRCETQTEAPCDVAPRVSYHLRVVCACVTYIMYWSMNS